MTTTTIFVEIINDEQRKALKSSRSLVENVGGKGGEWKIKCPLKGVEMTIKHHGEMVNCQFSKFSHEESALDKAVHSRPSTNFLST